MKVSFIGSPYGKRLAKTISAEGTEPYPNVSKVDSYEYEVAPSLEGLKQKASLIQHHADKGHTLVKGYFTQVLEKESRAGKCDTQADTQSLIIDIDNLVMENVSIPKKLDRQKLGVLAETFIKLLPDVFHDVSYILQASSSMGLKPGLNLHLEFFLTEPVSPRFLKDVLHYLNTSIPLLSERAELNSTGTAPKLKIDPSVADNAKLIYIAPPNFVDIDDPFVSPEERLVVMEKTKHLLDLTQFVEVVNPEKIANDKRKLVNQLRKNAGLAPKTEKTERIKIGQHIEWVVSNPDKVRMRFLKEDGDFLRFNLDRPGQEPGDSGAYYVFKSNPSIVFNFKGETPFLFPVADKEMYEWVLDQFSDLGDANAGRPFVFNDMKTDKLYKGFYDPVTNRLQRIDPVKRETGLTHFFTDHGFQVPEPIPQYDYAYLPPKPEGISTPQRLVNAYISSQYLRSNNTDIGTPSLDYGSFHGELKRLCPVISKVMFHALGANEEAFERFTNWLGHIAQKRVKSRTAWIIHGTQGTGKGMLFTDILTPLFGDENCSSKQMDNIEDQFNSWTANKLMILLDDFSINESKNPEALDAKIKHLITEQNSTQRAMHTDQMNVESFVNLIISSNKYTIVNIPKDDRRYNVAPRQETKILKTYPNLLLEKETIPGELPAFAKYLQQIKVDTQAIVYCWNNAAKKRLQQSSQTTVEEFVDNFRSGNLEYFMTLMEENATSSSELEIKMTVEKLLKHSLRYVGQQVGFRASDLAVIYNFMHRARMSAQNFSKMLQRNDLRPERTTSLLIHNGQRQQSRVYQTTWLMDETLLEQMKQAYLTDNIVPFPSTQI